MNGVIIVRKTMCLHDVQIKLLEKYNSIKHKIRFETYAIEKCQYSLRLSLLILNKDFVNCSSWWNLLNMKINSLKNLNFIYFERNATWTNAISNIHICITWKIPMFIAIDKYRTFDEQQQLNNRRGSNFLIFFNLIIHHSNSILINTQN